MPEAIDYEAYLQRGWDKFQEEKAEQLDFLAASIRVLSHYAESTQLDGDSRGHEVFSKFLDEARQSLRKAREVFPKQEKNIKAFFKEKGINDTEWD